MMSLGMVAGLGVAGSVAAQEWRAVVVGQSGPDAPRAFGDAFQASAALKAGGWEDVILLRDEPTPSIVAALDALSAEHAALVYLAGPLMANGTGVILADGPLTFDHIVARLQEAGVTQAALLVETCTRQRVSVRLPAPPDGMEMLRAASAQPGIACEEGGPRLTDALIGKVDAESSVTEVLSSVWVSSDLSAPPMIAVAKPKVAPVVSIVDTSSPVALRAVDSVTGTAATVTPVAFTAPAPRDTGQVVIFEAAPLAQQAALPLDAGLPQPSIIVGIIDQATPSAFAPAEDPAAVSGNEISFDDLEARQSLRAQDPDLFAQLLQSGAFDPPEPVLARALQTELARMGCYTSAIDGIWGNGSRRSVERYFDEIDGVSAVGLDPSTDLYRQIIGREDVRCVVPAASVTPRATTTPARTTTRAAPSSRQTQQRTRTAPQPQRQQQPSAGRTISNTNRLGLGVIR